MNRSLPAGTVTFLFTDIEGSTALLHALGDRAYGEELAGHRQVLRSAFTRHGGVEVDTQGDAFFVAFPTAAGAVAAATEAQDRLAGGRIRVRMAIHTGLPHVTVEGYVGEDVHKAARICAAGHGGQVLLSREARDLVEVEALDLGEHRVKDFGEPVWLYQLGHDRFPPLRTISNTNLPKLPSSFVGREREVRDVTERLRRGDRVVTLVGPGGTGKTRLAIEAATEVVPDHRNGVFWVGLASVRDPGLVTDAIGHAIGARNGLAEHIGSREMLLVLDNFEQVVEAAGDLSPLVAACPNLRLLVTSRELLRIGGEVAFDVPPLAEAEAVQLFSSRSGLPPDATVVELCRRLDHLPLAVELAAARTTALTPAQIVERLSKRLDLLKGGRDADPRQATLRATIAWSEELLSVEERHALAAMAVFRGGWTLDAAEEVADADVDTLQQLVEKSLVRRREDRFSMLETIREYAAERLAKLHDAEEIRERHFRHVVDLAERAYEEQFAAEGRWAPVLAAEHDNIRAALDWARDRHPEAEAQVAGAVAPYWMRRGHLPELRDRLDHGLRNHPAADAIRARALMHRGELDDDFTMLEAALALFRRLGDRPGEGAALEAIGWAHDAVGDYESAHAAYERSLSARRAAGRSDHEALLARAGLCHVFVALGDVERAESMARELLELATQAEPNIAEQLGLHFLADCSLLRLDFTEAEERYLRALRYARDARMRGRATDEVLGVAMSLAGQGRFSAALRLAAAAHVEQQVIGKGNDRWWQSMQDRHLGAARAGVTPEDASGAERAGAAMAFEAVLAELCDDAGG